MRMKCIVSHVLFHGACVCMLACVCACADTNTPATVATWTGKTSTMVTNQPSAVSVAVAVSNVEKMVFLDFQCVDMCTVLQWLAEFTGDTIIADPGVKGTVTIVNPQPTSQNRARQIIFSVLESKGFTAVRQMLPGGQGAVIKIVPKADAARKPIRTTVRPPLRPDATSTKEQ